MLQSEMRKEAQTRLRQITEQVSKLKEAEEALHRESRQIYFDEQDYKDTISGYKNMHMDAEAERKLEAAERK